MPADLIRCGVIFLAAAGAVGDPPEQPERTDHRGTARILRAGDTTGPLERFPENHEHKPVPRTPSVEPSRISGVVRKIGRDGAIETSYGTQLGLEVGQELDIVRDKQIIARIVIREVQADAGVGEVVPESLLADLRISDGLVPVGGPHPPPLKMRPPRVTGVVTKTSARGLVEITLGADDGLKVGSELAVLGERGQVLARIVIRETKPDQAVGQIIPDSVAGKLRAGDSVGSPAGDVRSP